VGPVGRVVEDTWYTKTEPGRGEIEVESVEERGPGEACGIGVEGHGLSAGGNSAEEEESGL
jgi:hypothetical protein